MHDEHPHPLLAQVPLTVSPFLSLPTATPLPYSYKQLPSTLPPSILSSPSSTNQTSNNSTQQPDAQPAYITSSTGTTATPDAILTSCLALQSHLSALEANARKTLQAWEEQRKAADLAEKRRVAPGWLDGQVKLLVPENAGTKSEEVEDVMGREMSGEGRTASGGIRAQSERRDGEPDERTGEELDRVFGGLDIK